MLELSHEQKRLISLGKELDAKRKLANWTAFRDARQTDYLRLVGAGVAGEMLDVSYFVEDWSRW